MNRELSSQVKLTKRHFDRMFFLIFSVVCVSTNASLDERCNFQLEVFTSKRSPFAQCSGYQPGGGLQS